MLVRRVARQRCNRVKSRKKRQSRETAPLNMEDSEADPASGQTNFGVFFCSVRVVFKALMGYHSDIETDSHYRKQEHANFRLHSPAEFATRASCQYFGTRRTASRRGSPGRDGTSTGNGPVGHSGRQDLYLATAGRKSHVRSSRQWIADFCYARLVFQRRSMHRGEGQLLRLVIGHEQNSD